MAGKLNVPGEKTTEKKSGEPTGHHTKAQRIGRFARLTMIYGGEKEGDINDVLGKVTPETALNFLQHVNSQLRNDKLTKKSDVVGDEMNRMMVHSENFITGGAQEFVAPEPGLQKELFGEYLDAMKKIKDKDKRALLAYYAINNLHLFSDGNGRTSRAIYYLIKNGDLSDANEVLEHKKSADGTVDLERGLGRKKFLSKNSFMPVEGANALANIYLQEQLTEEGLLDDNLKDKFIYIHSEKEKDGFVRIMMTKVNRQGLSDEEMKGLDFAMSDGWVPKWRHSTLSGLTMAIMLQKKGFSRQVAERSSDEDGWLPIRVNYAKYDGSDEVNAMRDFFAEWTPEDYKETLEVYRTLKKRQNEIIMGFFTEEIKNDNGESVADYLMGKNT